MLKGDNVETVINRTKPGLAAELQTTLLLVKDDALKPLRNKGKEYFSNLGFPTIKHEEWKYTNVIPAVSGNYDYPLKKPVKKFTAPFIASGSVVINLLNGYLQDEMPALPKGMTIGNISHGNAEMMNYLGQYADMHNDAFAALNTAMLNEGIYIKIDDNAAIEVPVYIINHTDSSAGSTAYHPRCLIVAGSGSKVAVEWLTVTENGTAPVFVNAVNEIVVKKNARLDFCILQNDASNVSQVCNTYSYQEADSLFNINTVTTGGNIVRNKLHIMLDGQHVETHLFGLYMGSGKQLIDNHTAVFHAKPNCFSNQRYKGIMDDEAQGVFNGKIMVMQDAQKTNAYQSNKNILLSDHASMFAKPQLEIFADDVKCSHGATTGQLDEEALFYLRSRGIGESAAKALLNVAFAADVIQNIPNEPLRNYILDIIHAKLIKD